MKKILLFLTLINLITNAQNSDSLKVLEQKKTIEKLNAIIDSKDEEDLLARILLDTIKVNVNNETLEIRSVEINISNGLLARVRVIFTNNLICETNKKYSIQLFQVNRFIKDIKLYNIKNPDSFICNLSDIITYIDELDKTHYLPKDELIVLTKDVREKKLIIQTDINSFVDFRIYSDMLALLNKEGNGLVQSEISSKITFNARSINKYLTLFNYVEPMFKLSKFDNQFKNQLVTDSTIQYKIDRLKLNQLAYVELGFRLNIIKFNLFQHTFDLLNGGMDFKYSDVLFKYNNSIKTLNTFGMFVETRGQILKYKNFGFEYGIQGYLQKIQDSSIEFYNLWDPYLITEFSLFYHPKSNPLNMIFVRFKNIQTGLGDDFYSLLQFGYKSKLSFKK